MAVDSSERFVLLNQLGEDFAERFRRGERPALQEYIDRHPELADEIREYFPEMVELEQVKEAREEVTEKPAAGPLPSLERLGDYRIIREIGRGGMGVVYEAEQVSLGRHVALKVLPRQLLADARTKQRFEREAKSAAKLHHTNIVPVFGVGEHEGLPYYVMQFIQGLGLDEVLEELKRMKPVSREGGSVPRLSDGELRVSRRDLTAAAARGDLTAAGMARSLLTGRFEPAADLEATAAEFSEDGAPAPAASLPVVPDLPARTPVAAKLSDSFLLSSTSAVLPGAQSGSRSGRKRPTYWQSVARIGVQVADALQHAHSQGVLHRDIKPSNLLLDTAGVVWVTDFGLAKADDQKNLTHSGDILGTLRYMPPEAFDGRSDTRGDVYSLGLTLYEMLGFRPAFDEKERNRLIKQVTTREPERLDRLNPDVPRDLVTIVHKAIERDPAHRYENASELMADLQRFVDDEPVHARRQTQWELYRRWARRNPAIAILGAVLTAVLVLATVASLIVAARMTSLARREASAAEAQKLARDEADRAREREAGQRLQADEARKSAQASEARAREALKKAEESFARARGAVNEYLTAVSDDPQLKAPGLSPLRAQLLQSARGFYEEFLRERATDPALRREIAAVHYKLGTILSDLGQSQAARASFAQSRQLYEAMAADAPQDPEIQDGLAGVLFRQGDNDRAIAIWEKLIRPDAPRYLASLGYAYNNASIAANRNDKLKELELLQKALMVRERLVQLRADDPDARLGLSGSLNNIAIKLPEDRNAEKLALMRTATEHGEAAYRLRPTDRLTTSYLAIQLQNLAHFAKLAGETEAELAAHRRRVEVLDRRVRDDPTVPGVETELVRGYGEFLTALRDAHRLDEAAKVADRARERIAEMSEETPEFFRQVSFFYLEVHSVALDRVKATPGGTATAEPEAAAAVNALRRYAISGWRDPNWMKTDPRTEPLRQRADFKELLAATEQMSEADAAARNTSATPQEKLSSRRKQMTTLEFLARPLPPAQFIRRTLAQALQDVAQALLDAGRIDEAKAGFDEALAERQSLLNEAPTDERLRIDLILSQISIGDLLAAAGRLADASQTWEAGIAALEAAHKANPNSTTIRATLLDRLLHVANQYAAVPFGIWQESVRHYRRAFAIQTPSEYIHWYRYSLVLAETGDTAGCRALAERAAAVRDKPSGEESVSLARTILVAASPDPGWIVAVNELAKNFRYPAYVPAERTLRARAFFLLGKGNEALTLVSANGDDLSRWVIVGLAEHLRGRSEAAREALLKADRATDLVLKDAVAGGNLWLPLYWHDWLQVRLLKREAHRLIFGQELPDSPYERLHEGRLLLALNRPDQAESEFTAAVALRPEDPEVWQTRARMFTKIGRKDRAAADLLHAQTIKVDDPKSWIDTGRALAEMGEQQQADTAFARASALGRGALQPFLESGWWAVGPYPLGLDLTCPPEIDPDPSKPVATADGTHKLKWQTVPYTPASGTIAIETAMGSQKNVSFYALAYVYADRDRTASFNLEAGDEPFRLWVNQKLAFEGYACWKGGIDREVQIPIALHAGRNTLLIKAQRVNGFWCNGRLHDDPIQKAMDLLHLGLWSEAADALAVADRITPLNVAMFQFRVHALYAARRDDEAQRAFGEMVRRFDCSSSKWLVPQVSFACMLPPEQAADRDLWIATLEQRLELDQFWTFFLLGYAEYRGGRFAPAEKHIRESMRVQNEACLAPLLASILHKLGRSDESRKVLQEAEERHSSLVKQGLASPPYRPAPNWEAELYSQLTLKEARRLILGKDSGPSEDEKALMGKARELRNALEAADDHFTRLAMKYPAQPRLWIEQGRRLGELGRWDEAARAFAKAVELAPNDMQVWKARGRAYAELGKRAEAAADLARMLNSLQTPPVPEERISYYKWILSRHGIDDTMVRDPDLYERLTALRPTDATLVNARVQYLIRHGRYGEAATVQERFVQLAHDHFIAREHLALLRLRSGADSAYRVLARQLVNQWSKTTEAFRAQYLINTCLMVQDTVTERETIRRWGELAFAGYQSEPDAPWMLQASVLADYRLGNYESAAAKVAGASRSFWILGATIQSVQAASLFRLGRYSEAEFALQMAQAAFDKMEWPERSVPSDHFDWWDTVRAETLLKEAQRLIPASKQDVPPVSLVQEQAARGKRKARAERISAQAALVLIGLDLGRKKDAETELRQVLAEREKLAQEEPANVDYQADLSATHILLARLHLTPEWTEIVPTAERQASLWRYTFEQPADNWACPDFDDSRWKQGPGGFGTPETPGALVGTVWNTPDIWIRRTIPTQPSISPAHLQLRVYHDDDIEIEINGQTVARLGEYTTQYKTVAPEPAALGMIRPASVLVLAAHCRNIGGGQGVDIGLSELVIKQGEFREAIAQLQTARDIWERLESTSPRRLRISHELASTFLDAAEAARKYGQTAEFDHALQAAAALSARMGSTPRGDEATVASLVRIVSSAWQSELPRARAACRDAAKVMKPVSRDKAFLELVRRAVLAVGLETPEANELLAATAGEPPPDLAEAVRLHSDQAKGFLDRADWYARRGLWKRAAADLAVANRLEPDHLGAARLGLLLNYLGEMDCYRDLCRDMLALNAGVLSNTAAEKVVRTCLLHPDSRVDRDRLARLIQVAGSGCESPTGYEWFFFCKALLAYRTGKYADALAACSESRRRNAETTEGHEPLAAADLAVEAMALHRQGQADAARSTLDAGKQLLDGKFSIVSGDAWWDSWLAAYSLAREAESLIERPKAETSSK